MNNPMDVSILIISYNTREDTLACLRSIYAQTAGVAFEVIVFDNDSHDGSGDAVAAAFPQARLIRSEQNVGFARGNNAAARHAAGAFLLLLNPDTEILDGAVQRVVAFAGARPDAAALGGRTFFADGSLNRNSCHGAPTPWSLFCQGTGLSSLLRRSAVFNPEGLGAWPRDTVRQVDCVTGCFLLIRRELWERLGGLDESFFMYGEDTDLCLRAAKLGHESWICPGATLIHHGGRSERVRADKMVRLFRAKVQLFERHWEKKWIGFGVRMLQLWAATRMGAMWIATKLGRDRRASYEAWRDVFRRRAEYGKTASRTAAAGPARGSEAAEPVRAAREPSGASAA